MTAPHPLDRPVWTALATGWAPLSEGDARARRVDPAYGPFAAAADDSADAMAALAQLVTDETWLVEREAMPAPPGAVVDHVAICCQMVAEAPARVTGDLAFVELRDADAPQMRALAALTRPGPFRELTHRFGGFIGIRIDGRLVAMAGQRMRAGVFTEVSGVCTHPDARGRGYAGALMRTVAARIVARGETPFLHVYASNTGAIALYETLGYRTRTEVALTVLRRDATDPDESRGQSA